jgi:hypothetical protein
MAWEPDYVDADDLAAYLRIEDADAEGDAAELALAVTAASRSIDGYCRRQFGSTPTVEERTFSPRSTVGGYVLDVDDIATATGLLIDGLVLDPFTQRLEPTRVRPDRPWTRVWFDGTYWPLGTTRVTVTATWGWPEVPASIEQACRIQAARYFKRRDAPFGIAGSPEAGSEMRLLAKLDPDVAVLVNRYRRIARPQ